MKNVEFTEAMNNLMRATRDYCGHDDVMETIFDWFDDNENCNLESEDSNDWFAFKPNEEGLFYLLRTLMNYDFFWCRNGKIDVKNANVPEAAKILKPYITREMANKALATF